MEPLYRFIKRYHCEPIATVITSTQYIVTGTAANGCKGKDTINIGINQLPTVLAAKANDLDCINPSAQLNATGALSYIWSPTTGLNNINIANPIATPATTTTYTVTGTDNKGCKNSSAVIVNVNTASTNQLFVKGAFTPNGDGINDKWIVSIGSACTNLVSVRVFNRYGGLVYNEENYRNTWDGTYKGAPLPDGTYYYVVKFGLITGSEYILKGDLNIIR